MWFGSLPSGFLIMIFCLTIALQPAAAEEIIAPGSNPRIPGIHEQLEKLVEQQEISGAVTMVVSPDQVLHLDAVGKADQEKHLAMKTDSIFWIASLTKLPTGLAICKLQEEGKLKLDDPVELYIPEFKQLKNAQGEPVQVTILHLLTHTSGLQNIEGPQAQHLLTLKEMIPEIVAAPVRFRPGSKWEYNQAGINTAGRIVEILSGLPFDEYVDREFFSPLKMVDTTFYLSEQQLPRLVQAYRRTEEGKLEVETEHALLKFGKDPTKRDRPPLANGGLFSTAPDFARLCQMLLNAGELDGHRYLQPETVQLFRTIQTPPDIKTGFTPGNGWGVAACVVREPQGITAELSPGTFGHGGVYGTQAWIDPERKIAWVLMVQRSNFKNSDDSVARKVFQDALFSERP